MAQSALLIQTLKQLLKAQSVTYKGVAGHLNLSEASVKRMFAHQQLSLDRIDAICELLGIEISDLLFKMQHSIKRINELTLEQEKTIVSDRKLCLVTICVLNHWSLAEILDYYQLSEHECIRYLAELDNIKLIELLPKNKIKLLVSPGFHWLTNGPIQTFFQKYIFKDFAGTHFQGEHESMICQFGMLTNESMVLFRKKLQDLAKEFLILTQQDAGLPVNKKVGNACVLMSRPWAPAIFTEFIKPLA